MTGSGSASSAFLRAVDSLCEDLRNACGLTRFSIVIDRCERPLTISFEDDRHPGLRLAPTAYLEVELTDGDRRLGYVELHNALTSEYSKDTMRVARDLVERHAVTLRAGIPV